MTMLSSRLPKFLLVMLLIGCGKASDGRMEISGTVTLEGGALDEGVIEFLPLAASDRAAPTSQSGAVITEGAYKIPREKGLFAGTYKVLITAGDGKTPVDGELPGPTGNIVSVDRIPPEYNVDSKQQVQVTPEGPNVFDYIIP
jgi:hypothetical protein